MRVLSLTLENFRNVSYEKISFEKGLNFLVGKNAQGKTNILEAIAFCAYLKSFRGARDEQLIKSGEKSGKITLEYDDNGKNVIEIGLFSDKPKTLKKNGVPVQKNRELVGSFLAIVFTPDNLNIIKEGPNRRRAFLDMTLCAMDIKYTDTLLRYKKLLQMRNVQLKKGQNPELLDVYDLSLARAGGYIALSRAQLLEKLDIFSKTAFSDRLRAGQALKLLYINQFSKKIEDEKEAERAIYQKLCGKRESDIQAGVTQFGVHKDDFLMLSGGKSLKYFGSQGQIRAAALSLLFAQSEIFYRRFSVYPVVIMDDILSELDRTRRKLIFTDTAYEQGLISTCETQKVKNRGNIIKISGGRVI